MGAELSRLATLSSDRPSEGLGMARARRRRVAARWAVGAVTCYLALGVLAYWGAWSGGASRTSLCGGCGDIALNSWFLAWTPFAILHGHSPFFTTWVNYPHGANLLDNASILLPGLLAAPVTLLAGPLASFNLLSTLAFPGSAAAAFFALRRFAPWPPAAFVGGLLYGFSPYMVNQGYAHLNLILVAIPPLVLLVLDEVLVRQRGRPVPWGIALGLLVVAQFFTSTEVLASTAIMAFLGAVVVLIAGRPQDDRRLHHAGVGLLTAGVVAGVLLAFPVYLLVAGPQHVNGPAQPNGSVYSANLGGPIVPPASMLLHTGQSARTAASWFGNPDGAENDAYLGIPLLVALALVGGRFWRERTVRFGLAMAGIAFVLALGPQLRVGDIRTGVPLPFALFQHLPLLESLLSVRFMLYVVLFAALVLAVGIDRAREAAIWTKGRLRAGAAVTLLGLAGLVPLVPRWPYGTQPEVAPRWFTSTDVRVVPAGQVVITYPFGPVPYRPMLWQAQAGMRYRIPDGDLFVPGLKGRPTVSANPTTLQAVLGDYYGGAPAPAVSPPLIAQLRADVESLKAWAVVVAPEGAAPGKAVDLFQQVLGEPPRRYGGVAVWTNCPAAPGEHRTSRDRQLPPTARA